MVASHTHHRAVSFAQDAGLGAQAAVDRSPWALTHPHGLCLLNGWVWNYSLAPDVCSTGTLSTESYCLLLVSYQ